MEQTYNEADELLKQINANLKQLKIDEKKIRLDTLLDESKEQNFWSNNLHAQGVMKEIAKLQEQVSPWLDIRKQVSDLKELSVDEDKDLDKDIKKQLKLCSDKLASLNQELKYGGDYADHDAIVSIYAGAGGTDAQDWTQILFRMYSRWADKQGFVTKVIEESPGEEAGLKSVTVEVSGKHVYAKLKGENGVHRLVRLSPFNADHLRQTSFAKVEVLPEIERPDEVEIDDKDIKTDVFRSGGHGGQSVNTTDSAVRLTHLPTGISVAIQNERSQLQNKETAMTILRSKLAQLQLEQHEDHVSKLKGPNLSAEWGNQIRNYVMHPYKQVKDVRTKAETTDIDAVLDGWLDKFIDAYQQLNLGS
ncbi:MAG TPA: peptide chain release factor 2 [Candidatus Sulfotelmatobacter sp.]|nr:peptide chain release factor 2 [Candidatus Sulfotelmatobacter sp.]